MGIHLTEQRSSRTDGRKTTNAALITLLRAGVIASIMILVLGAGIASAAALNDSADGYESTDIQSAPLGDNQSTAADPATGYICVEGYNYDNNYRGVDIYIDGYYVDYIGVGSGE